MKKLLSSALITSVIFSSPIFASAAGSPKSGGGGKQMISVTAMALTSSTKQGGEGPSGSTVLTQSEYIYAFDNFGMGLFFNYDMQGSSEKDSAYGPKFEAYMDPFYIELGYAITAKKAYTDRTIADQTGTGYIAGVGVRFGLGGPKGGAGGGGWFFQAAYKIRNMTITKQDGAKLSESIIQQDAYPLVGIGFKF